jgi:hypothetical protein
MNMRSQVRDIATVTLLSVCSLALTAAPVAAQVEVSIEAGYSGSEGINASENKVLLGQQYKSLDLTSGSSFGFTVGGFLTDNWELEFLWHRQFSTMEASNPAPSKTLANQNIDNYHGDLVYNWGARESKLRPFLLAGLGATHYVPGDYDSSLPLSVTSTKIGGFTKFSPTWGGGVKAYPNPHIGLKGTVRWTPTYIKSDAAGIWCDAISCWVLGDPDYANQLEFSGGITFRFGGSR